MTGMKVATSVIPPPKPSAIKVLSIAGAPSESSNHRLPSMSTAANRMSKKSIKHGAEINRHGKHEVNHKEEQGGNLASD